MPARKGFSERAWDEIINAGMNGAWVDEAIKAAARKPDAPFADAGPLLAAILQRGVTRDQLCRLARSIRYEAVFEAVQLAAEEGLDGERLEGVHEELLMADPSGKAGRPGSWPIEPEPARKSSRPSKPVAKSRKPPAKADETSAGGGGRLLKLPKGDDFAFSPDGSRLWLAHTSINASTIRGVSIPGGGQFAEFNSLPNLRRLACAPNAKRIGASNHDGIVALHDAATGKEIWKTPKTGDETRCLAYAPDGSMVLNTGGGASVRRRDAHKGKELPPLGLGAGWLGGALAFSPDGKVLAVAAVKVPGQQYVSYWDWRTGKELGRHPDRGLNSDICFLPDGRGLVSASNKQVNFWDVKSHARTRGFDLDHGLKGVGVHPERPLLAVNTYEGSEVRELPSGIRLRKLDTKQIRPSHVAFSPDGRHLLLVASPKSFLWDLDTLLAGD